jgi:hypothetical protein
MKNEDKKTLAISIIMIIFLVSSSFISIRRQQRQEGSLVPKIEDFRLPEIPTINMFDIEKMISEGGFNESFEIDRTPKTEDGGYQTKTINDEIEIDIPLSWKETSAELYSEYIDIIDIYFLATSENKLDPLFFSIMKFEGESFNSVLNEAKDVFAKEKVKMIVFESSEKDNLLYFSAEYKGENMLLYSKEKIINIDNRYYLVSVIGSIEEIDKNNSKIDAIFNSVQIIK